MKGSALQHADAEEKLKEDDEPEEEQTREETFYASQKMPLDTSMSFFPLLDHRCLRVPRALEG